MTDLELLQAYTHQRKAEALEEIVRRYSGMVLGAAHRITGRRHDAEDVAQACFLEFIEKAPEVTSSVAGYLHCLATRRAMDLVRRRMTRNKHEHEASQVQQALESAWRQIEPDLDAAMGELDEPSRAVLVQHYLMGRTQTQIAEDLQVNQSTIARRLSGALAQLRGVLTRQHAMAIDAAMLATLLEQYAHHSASPAFISATVAKVAGASASASAGTVAFAGVLAMKKVLIISAAAVVIGAASMYTLSTSKNSGHSTPTVAATRPIGPSAEELHAFFTAVSRYDDVPKAASLLKLYPDLVKARLPENGETALHHAMSVSMAKLLLDAGADGLAVDKTYKAHPVRWMVDDWRPEVVAFMESRGFGDDDLVYNCATGKDEKVLAVLKQDKAAANLTSSGRDVLGRNRSLLHIASVYGQAKICSILIDHGADLACEGGGFSNAQPLEFAAWAGFPDVVQVLVDRGADVNAVVNTPDQGDHTALWWAALTGRKEIVAILLKAGASVEPALIDAVRESKINHYGGRALPPREDYEAVIDLLQKHSAGE